MTERRNSGGKLGRLAIGLAASAALALAVGAAQAQQHHHQGGGYSSGGYSGGHGGGGRGPSAYRGHGPVGYGHAGPSVYPGPGYARGGGPLRYDPRQHNGYWVGPSWHYGPPPGYVTETPGYRPGFAPWRPGAMLPPSYEAFVIDEYWRFHLRRPPYGYHWVRTGDEFLLVSIATGQIFDVVSGF